LNIIEKFITDQHYKRLTWGVIFVPLSYCFFVLLSIRKFLYKIQIFKSNRLNIPVIIIGNITLGGTGKTPIIMSLTNAFKKRKLNVGIIARGYKSKFSHAREVFVSSDYLDVGDEPLLLKQKLQCPVYVGVNRYETAKNLLNKYPNTDLILSDDGLQHYALSRDFEIIVVDGLRYFGNQFLTPAGPLREPLNRLENTDMVIVTNPSLSKKKFSNAFYVYEKNEKFLISNNKKKDITCENLKGEQVIAMTGIGNPEKFFKKLELKKLSFKKKIFPDHYEFKQKDFDQFEDKKIIMTEKDAIKCNKIKHNNIWVLPLTLSIDTSMINKILQKVGLN
tara:strand:- start:35917 stop:36918 length:1002 start_codon:yes stop_codon:yes gene_type:complete